MSKDTPVVALLLVLVAAVVAALPPLHETDLAQHLATGEWIVRHGAVPFTEPFAWTRAGEPYFAYSWLAQVLYFGLLDAFGPIALHLLSGVLTGAAVAAAWWAARQFGLRQPAATGVALLHLALLWGVAPILRPQQFLFVAVPLAWGFAARVRASGSTPTRLLAFAIIGVLAANTHIFFPLTAVPIIYFLALDGQLRRWLPAAAALVAGWLINPYALALPAVFALNFGHNILLTRPPSILEFVPGFEYATQRVGVIAAVVALLAAPWIALRQRRATREYLVLALFWTAGLVLFSFAGRLAFAWWLFAFPLIATAAQALVSISKEFLKPEVRRVAWGGAGIAVFLAAAPPISPVFWQYEGDTVHRMLPRGGEDPALWLPSWLLCNTQAGATGRIFTEFNYGSELNWRLPGFAPSIDGRTIFPDSIAVDFSFQPYGRRPLHAATWQSADLVLIDQSFWLTPIVNSDPGWILLAVGRRTSWGSFGALWATQEWWSRWGSATTAVPATDIRPGDPRGICEATGVFPKQAQP